MGTSDYAQKFPTPLWLPSQVRETLLKNHHTHTQRQTMTFYTRKASCSSCSGRSQVLVLMLFLSVISDVLCLSTRYNVHSYDAGLHLPQIRRRNTYRGSLLRTLLNIDRNELQSDQPRCLRKASQCNPWSDNCCPGLECMTYTKGFCMGEFEPCACFPIRDQLHGKGEIWYKRSMMP